MSTTNYAISIIVILILGLIVKEAIIPDSIKIILCTIVGLVAYSSLNTLYITEKFATIAPVSLQDNMKPGTIVIWSGSMNDIPIGWALCDGSQRTGSDEKMLYVPDLRGRFVLGVNNQEIYDISNNNKKIRSKYNIEYTKIIEDKNEYGRENVILDISNIPSHDHYVGKIRGSQGYSFSSFSSCDYGWSGNNNTGCPEGASKSSAIGGDVEGKTASFSIMPPYYVLAYIIKL